MTRERWTALAFAIGSTCFLVGPFPGYVNLVGESADAATFFAGSLFFTAGGALQLVSALPGRHAPGAGNTCLGAACFLACALAAFATRREEQLA